jgi:hypothetical protein
MEVSKGKGVPAPTPFLLGKLFMIRRWSILLAALATVAFVDDNARGAESAPPVTAGPAAAEQAIRASSAAFVTAFNLGDAQAVAALWAPEGEYVDEGGQRFTGRDAIQKEYAAFFTAHRCA